MSYNPHLKALSQRVGWLILGVAAASLTTVLAVFLLIDVVTDLGSITSLVISLLVGAIVAFVVTQVVQQKVLKPLAMIKQAVDHVEADKSVMPAPDIDQISYGKELVEETVTQVYNLATMAQGLTADIQAKKAFFRRTLNAVPLAIYTLDQKDNLSFANDVGRAYLDVEYQDALGQNIFNLIKLRYEGNNNLRDWLRDCKTNKIKEQQVWERVTITRTDHTRNEVDIAASYNKGSSEGVDTIVVVFDKTEIYQYDEKEKDYMALAAHEIRGPVTVIRGYIDVLMQELNESDVEKIELINKISESADRLAGYVSNIMKIARVDQGTMSIHVEEVDWKEVITKIAQEQAMKSQGTGKTISLNAPENLPTGAADVVAISEVVNNIIDNAMKYGRESDNIEIAITDNGDELETTITDHGKGIPAVVVDKLFSKFYRSHRSRHEISGTGIGLYVCKAIVEAHNGNIWVRSKEGKGSTFGFTIPTYKAAAASSLETDSQHPEITRSRSGWIKNHSMRR